MPSYDARRILDLTKAALAPFAERAFAEHFGGFWVEKLSALGLKGPRAREGVDAGARWDSQVLLKSIQVTWNDVFRSRLPEAARSYIGELKALRNSDAHEEPVPEDDLLRAADTARRLALAAGAKDVAEELATLVQMQAPGTARTQTPGPRLTAAPAASAGSSDASPWTVLNEQPLLVKAREEFGVASINPFYSNPEHTLREGPIYLVAQNPGGVPGEIPSQTREKPLDHPPRPAHRRDWCKPLDEVWGTEGTNYQRNIRFLAEELLPGGAEGLRDTFCTNAVFVRGDLSAARVARDLWDLCRPWHVAWLQRVKPRVILCLGNGEGASAYAWFARLVQRRSQHPEVPTSNTAFRLKSCEGDLLGTHATVIGMPHPARWSPSAAGSRHAVEEARRRVRAALER